MIIKNYSCVSTHTYINSVKTTIVLCIIFLFLFYVKKSFSQPVGDFWDISGNSNLTEMSRLGSDNDMPINFVTNNQLRMRLMPDGKFGIGLENPQHTLHIHSSEMINPNDISSPSDNTSVRGINLATSYAYNAIQITNSATGMDKGNGLLVGLRDKNAFINLQEKANMMFQINGSTSFSIFPNRNIGIGTNNDEAKLNIFALKQNGVIVTNYNNDNGYTIKAKVNKDNTKALLVEGKNKENFVVYGNGNTKIGTGTAMLCIGKAQGADLGWGTSYVGFNGFRQDDIWTFNGDQAHNGGTVIYSDIFGNIKFVTVESNSGGTQTLSDTEINDNLKMIIRSDGKVGIGTVSPQYELDVAGIIRGCKVKANNFNGWCDYVFDKDYKLQSLSELEKYIKQNKHLPDMPTEKQVLENGIDLGEMNMKLLQKIEELTLYTIKQQKMIDKLKKEVDLMKKKNK